MTTLDDLLGLLPDNNSGEISAEDMRQIVTALWTETKTVRSPFSYAWDTTNPTPDAGWLSLDMGWDETSTLFTINKFSLDGEVLPGGLTVDLNGGSVTLMGPTTSVRVVMTIVGSITDTGTAYQVPVFVHEASGLPVENEYIRTIFSWSTE